MKTAGLKGISEKEFTRQVIQLARTFQYAVYHTFMSKWSEKGYPDCCFAKPGRLIFAELKSEAGKVSEKQQEWLDILRAAGAETYLWKPSQFEEIVKILRSNPLRISRRETSFIVRGERRQPHIEALPTGTLEQGGKRRGGRSSALGGDSVGETPTQEQLREMVRESEEQ